MEIVNKLIFKEIPNSPEFVFDEESLKIFYNDFWENREMPLINIGLDGWSCFCSNCESWNCHAYKDCIVCFSCKNHIKFPLSKRDYILVCKNGYLARKHKKSGEIQYFHRFLLNDKLVHKKYNFEVHHKNFNKKDNRLINLQIILKEDHYKIHHLDFFDDVIHKEYEKFSIKKSGEYSNNFWIDFINLIEKKDG